MKIMFAARTVGYSKYGNLDVYVNKLDVALFDKAVMKFAEDLNVDIGEGQRDLKDMREYAFSNMYGNNEVEICYNPKTCHLVVASSDRSKVEQFVKCIPEPGYDTMEDIYQDVTYLGSESQHKKGILGMIAGLFDDSDRSDVPESLIDRYPAAYNCLDDGEKKFVDECDMQLVDLQKYVFRKAVIASHLDKINSMSGKLVSAAKNYTMLEERNADVYDLFRQDGDFWKGVSCVGKKIRIVD